MFGTTKEKQILPKKHTVFVNLGITVGILVLTTAISSLFSMYVLNNRAILYMLYILALVCISKYTSGYWYGIISSVLAAICVNYIFTYPYFKLDLSPTGYLLAFIIKLAITLIVCTMTSNMRKQAEIIYHRETLLREAETEKMRANLLRAVSHDLRTPLTGMIGNSSIYLENYDSLSDAERLELVRSINGDANWLLNMVENLLTVTRIRGDNFKIKTSFESVEEVVSEALLRLNKRFPKSKICASVPEEILFIPMDAVLIEQVIINLIENAIVHSNSTKPIELIVDQTPTQVSFIIKDYGKGISPERMNQLFDSGGCPTEDRADAHKGMGIGLSICQTIITAHRGEIYGENHANGAQFCFYLPKEDVKDES